MWPFFKSIDTTERLHICNVAYSVRWGCMESTLSPQSGTMNLAADESNIQGPRFPFLGKLKSADIYLTPVRYGVTVDLRMLL